ncbi:putative transcriptional regulator (plasmid) [Desulfosporosinus acidiphilus SJ4]|uniref:Putative transcriptional regulator n=1 Tax=Desulfosporosinus acidiphilus (strain DSM 22704 / JCM 16185 / SJ4) TaxID=646529 RepID=I4DCT0_DESAJ|nr:helix-turn-helix transcriptional regulator [Desulfosporosinus acidiphilus]AFM43604.1 putative transcriptional regulator [Desulfosporosinus acidiphilus SJ4]
MINNIKDIRTKKGKTQEELARQLNISLRSYQYIENSKQLPNVLTALKLAKLLNTRAENLYTIEQCDWI